MELPAGPFYVLPHGGQQYLCYYSQRVGSSFRVCVTNACECWSSELTQEKLEGDMPQSGLCTLDSCDTKFREAFEHRAATLTVHDSKASLQLEEDTWSLTFDLFKLPLSEARKRLQALMLGLVGRVQHLEKRLEAAEDVAAAAVSCSPEKGSLRNPSLFTPDLSPRAGRGGGGGGPAVLLKRRAPGESLVNPGFKSKKAPTGVDFEDL
uniref:PAXX non-homologous end joining factor n=1 Tax=Sphenodon punctatus TaxID=8508 RepID=A0A8D0GH84_SPHPU